MSEFEKSLNKFLEKETYIVAYRSNYDSAREFNNELINYIKELQQENADLKERYNNMFECHCNRVQVEQLQNNWNELKSWGEKKIENANNYLKDPNENWDEDTRGYVLARKFQLEEMLKKMKELENNNE